MAVFARKHYGKGRAGLLSAMLHAGIWLRASLSALGVAYGKHVRPAFARLRNITRKGTGEKVDDPARIMVAGSSESTERVRDILARNGIGPRSMARIEIAGKRDGDISRVEGIRNLLLRMKVNEIVLCPDYISYGETMRILQHLPSKVRVSISADGSGSIVGSGIRRG
jgi:hypothetical protein